MVKLVIIKPKKNRKKVISIAGIFVPVVTNLANTVADEKHNSASTRKRMPLTKGIFDFWKNLIILIKYKIIGTKVILKFAFIVK